MGKTVILASNNIRTASGSAGLQTQVPGAMTSVSNAAQATGGISAGNFIQSDTK